jgi:hypothetical protein
MFFFLFIALFVLLTWRDAQRVYRLSRLSRAPAPTEEVLDDVSPVNESSETN